MRFSINRGSRLIGFESKLTQFSLKTVNSSRFSIKLTKNCKKLTIFVNFDWNINPNCKLNDWFRYCNMSWQLIARSRIFQFSGPPKTSIFCQSRIAIQIAIRIDKIAIEKPINQFYWLKFYQFYKIWSKFWWLKFSIFNFLQKLKIAIFKTSNFYQFFIKIDFQFAKLKTISIKKIDWVWVFKKSNYCMFDYCHFLFDQSKSSYNNSLTENC